MNSQSLGERTVSPCLSCSSSSPVAFAMAATTVRGRILHPGLSTSHCRVPGSSRSHNFSMFITDAPTFEISLCMENRGARCGREAAGLHVSPPCPARPPSVVPAQGRGQGSFGTGPGTGAGPRMLRCFTLSSARPVVDDCCAPHRHPCFQYVSYLSPRPLGNPSTGCLKRRVLQNLVFTKSVPYPFNQHPELPVLKPTRGAV